MRSTTLLLSIFVKTKATEGQSQKGKCEGTDLPKPVSEVYSFHDKLSCRIE